MRQSLVMLLNPLDQMENPLICDQIPSQVQRRYHIPVHEELAELKNLLIADLLIFNLDAARFYYSPALDRSTEVLMHWRTLEKNNFVYFLVWTFRSLLSINIESGLKM